MKHPLQRAGTLALACALLLACDPDGVPAGPPTLSVGQDASADPAASAGGSTPPLLNSPDPSLLPQPGGPFGGLPTAPRPTPSGATPRPSPSPLPRPPSPTPLPSPGPGQVLVLAAVVGGTEPPVAGALVEAGVGGVATDAQGIATVPRANGASLVVRAKGAGTLVVGNWDGAPTTLRLNFTLPPANPQAIAQLPASGEVVDDEGNPVVGAYVEGGDGQGGSFGPVRTDGQGRFQGFARSVRGADGSGFTFFAQARGGRDRVEGLGMAKDLTLGEGSSPTRLVLTRPTADMLPGWTEASGGSLEAEAWVEAPNGARSVLRTWQQSGQREPVQRFALEGVIWRYRFVRQAENGAVASGILGAWPTGDRLNPELLAYPSAFSAPGGSSLSATTRLTAPSVTGAESYALRLLAENAQSPHWEGLNGSPSMQLSGYPNPAPVAKTLEFWAMAGPGATQRELLSFGPRGLRLDHEALREGRWAWRRLRLSL